MRSMSEKLEGVGLVRAVIEIVRAKGFREGLRSMRGPDVATPVPPEVLDKARLDGDLPLTPSMKEWLAFDGTLFGWFTSGGDLRPGAKVGRLVDSNMEACGMFAPLERTLLPRRGHALPFGDQEYFHFVYPSRVDAIGELPVISAELENQQILIGYPGIDAFLGHRAGLLGREWRAAFAARLKEHATHTLSGKMGLEMGDDDFPMPSPDDPDEGAPPNEELPPGVEKAAPGIYVMAGDGDVPPGFIVVQEGENPYTKERFRRLARV